MYGLDDAELRYHNVGTDVSHKAFMTTMKKIEFEEFSFVFVLQHEWSNQSRFHPPWKGYSNTHLFHVIQRDIVPRMTFLSTQA